MITVLHIADRQFALRERDMLQRLRLGLADEGVRAINCLPESAEAIADDGILGRALTYPSLGGWMPAALRTRALVAQLSQDEAAAGDIRAVHCFGGGGWFLGLALARRFSCPLVLEAWRSGLTTRIRVIRAAADRDPTLHARLKTDSQQPAAGVLGPLLPEGRLRLFISAPDALLGRKLRADLPACDVRTVPWGVRTAAPDDGLPPKRPAGDDDPIAIAIVSPGRDAHAFSAAANAAIDLLEAHPRVHVFADAEAAARTGLWSAARDVNASARVTLIERPEAQRSLITRCDLVVFPEARGERRSIVLDAMAAGVPIIAAKDPRMPWLTDRETALLVPTQQRADFRRVLDAALRDTELRHDTGEAARDYARMHHQSSTQIAALLDLYDAAAGITTAVA